MARTAVTMRTLGESVNSMDVMATAKALSEAVKLNPSATVAYQLYDSSIFFSSSAPGERVLPRRGGGWKIPRLWRANPGQLGHL